MMPRMIFTAVKIASLGTSAALQDAVAAQMSIEAAGLDAATELIEATGISGPPKCDPRGRP